MKQLDLEPGDYAKRAVFLAFLAFLAFLPTPTIADGSATYTLYRNSALDMSMRIHVATFDAADGHDYNFENCMLAADLFQSQPMIRTRFWCERGPYQP